MAKLFTDEKKVFQTALVKCQTAMLVNCKLKFNKMTVTMRYLITQIDYTESSF